MERSTWTDERVSQLAERSESQFELLRGDIRAMQAEMRSLRTELHADMKELRTELRTELRSEIGGLRGETQAIRRDMFHGAIALFATFGAMWATMLAHVLS